MAAKMPTQITPTGRAAYAWIAKKDVKFSKEGTYKITVVLNKGDIDHGRVNYGKDAVEGEQWIKDLLKLAKDNGAIHEINAKGSPVKTSDKEEFENCYLLEFKTSYPPKLVDTRGNDLPSNMTVNSGDIVKVAFQPKVQEAQGETYLSRYIAQIMLIQKGSSLDFGDVEGYVAPEGVPAANDEVAGDAGDNNGDF